MLIFVVRIGAVVTILTAAGWESVDVNPTVADRYPALAVAAIKAWRQGH